MIAPGKPRKIPYAMLSVFLLLVIGILFVGRLQVVHQTRLFKQEKESELAAVADLRVKEITRWLQEHMSDAAFLLRADALTGDLRRWLEQPGASSVTPATLEWLASLKEHCDYTTVSVVDRYGETRLTIPADVAGAEEKHPEELRAAMVSGKPVLLDMRQDSRTDSAHLGIIVPFVSRDGSGAEPFGVLILRIDPRRFLYPLLASWPTSSESAETCLVRREGAEVVILNELARPRSPALAVRLPMTAEQQPAVMAVRGYDGVVEGLDRRGVPVLAALRAIPGTPWFLVAQEDQDEVYAPIRSNAVVTMLLVAVLILLAAISTGFLWIRENAGFYRRRHEIEADQVRLANRCEFLMQQANDIILMGDARGNIVEANDRAISVYGYARQELLGLGFADLQVLDDRSPVDPQPEGILEPNGVVFEALHRRKDGSVLPVEVSSRSIDFAEGSYFCAMIRDISERKQTEDRIYHLNRLYTVLSEINQTIVKTREREQLFRECCCIAVGQGDFSGAWIGVIDPENGELQPVAHSPDTDVYLHQVCLAARCVAEDNGPTGTAMREARVAFCDDIEQDQQAASWSRAAIEMGFRSSAAIPLTLHHKVVGVFNVYARVTHFFNPAEIRLLDEIGCDLSFALETIEHDAQRREAEARLLESESTYRTIFENTGTATVILEENSLISLANRGFATLSGYAREELEGLKCWWDFVSPEARPRMQLYYESCRRDPDSVPSEFEFLFVDRTRRIRDVYLTVSVIPGTGKTVASLLDVSELEMTKEILRESEARYRELVENASIIILRMDSQGVITFLNEFGQEFFGYTQEELLGRSVVGSIVRESEKTRDPRTLFDDVLRQPELHLSREIEHVRRNGEHAWVSWRISRMIDRHGRQIGLLACGHDLTQQRMIEEQYRQAQRMEAVGRLAGGIAHDFNNLLGVITGYSDMAIMKLAPEDALYEPLAHIRDASTRAATLTRQLLAFSRKQVLEPRVLNLNDVIAGTERMLRRLIGEDIDLVTVLEPTLGSVKVDPGQMEQVIMNLAVNARDAMPAGGRLSIETCNVKLDDSYAGQHLEVEPGHYVMLAVSDNGCGMDDATLAQVFEPFFTTKGVGKGTGLGLATVYGIIRQSSGHIWVYSEPGEGSNFRIYLPRVDAAAESLTNAEIPVALARGSETILLVEDEEGFRGMIRQALREFGYQVIEAPNADAAVKIATQHEGPIHLVLSDVVMPGMPVRTMARELSALRGGIKILFMSGYTDDAITHRGVLDPGTAFLQKPFSHEELSRKIRALLDESG